jgi:aspartyl protease family protein
MKFAFSSGRPVSVAILTRAPLVAALFWCGTCHAVDVSVAGVFPGKAVVVINGGAPRTLSVGGASVEGVKLVAVEGGAATLEFDGRRHKLTVGEHAVSSGAAAGDAAQAVTLTADGRGHFLVTGNVNGAPIQFMVDTGATLISLGSNDALRAGIDYRQGQPITTMTANGPAQAWRIKVASVQIGAITLRDVDAAIHAAPMPIALLGMSFLNRMEMRRDGETMTLRRRF